MKTLYPPIEPYASRHVDVGGGHRLHVEEAGNPAGVDRIRHLPAVIVQGRYDLCCPPATAHDLHRRWPEAAFHVIPDAGHSSLEPGITDRLIRSTDHFAGLLG